MTGKVGIGQNRKPALQVLREAIEALGIRFETKVNDHGALVAIVYRDDKKIREIGIDKHDVVEKKILAVMQRNEGRDKRAAYEERFISTARSGGFRRVKRDA